MSARRAAQETWLPWVPRVSDRLIERDWLLTRGSLTARVQAGAATFRLARLRQELAPLTVDEARCLGLRPGQRAIVREVVLHADEQPLVFARSVCPAARAGAARSLLRRVGMRPLGAVLFSDPRVRRRPLAFCRIGPEDRRYPARVLSDVRPCLWSRRSVFTIGTHPLLVTEVFLPAIRARSGPVSRTPSALSPDCPCH